MMERYIFLKSSDCSEYYPNNKPYDFKIHLNTTIDLNGYWKLGIAELFTLSSVTSEKCSASNIQDKLINHPIVKYRYKPLYVYCNVCQFSSVNGTDQPLLRVIHPDGVYGWNDKFDPVYYFPVRVNELSDIHIYLKDDTNSPASFVTSDVWITLHLRRYPF